MFLELSFDSRAGDKEVSASKATRRWRYDNDEQQEMSLDELISDFRQSTTSRRSKMNESVSRSEASPLQVASPPKHSKAKESGKNNRSFADRARVAQRESTTRGTLKAAHKSVRDDDSGSDDDGAVMPMPRLEQVLRNKPSLLPKRRVPPVPASTRLKTATRQSRKPSPPSPVLSSSPSLSPASLSPVTSSSAKSSPLSMPDVALTPAEDSIDALIGKDIRELNKLIAASSRGSQNGNYAAKSTSSDEIGQVLRQSTRFGTKGATSLRPRLRLQMPKGSKSRSAMPESPPPPPPPEDDEDSDEDEEDSFAEEIRKLRASRRLNSLPVKAPAKEEPKDEAEPTSSEICATAALKVRNASNAINGLLLEALKPFEDRKREEDEAEALEKENDGGDSAIRKAAQTELQTATQTIVSQLDLTFADMTERRKADLKAEADAAAAAKDAEKKEKEAVEEKKKADEKEAKQREMEILRMIPMQGKLLTSSADIENVLMQLETMDASTVNEPAGSTLSMEDEIKALRSHTQRKIEAIEARMAGSTSAAKTASGKSSGISWRAIDWVQDNLEMEHVTPPDRGDNQVEPTVNSDVDTTTAEEEGPLQEVLQRHVLEKLDLTMLKLKHVLAIDAKESAEKHAKQKREEEERAKQLAQQQLEDERKLQELEDAENARRRVMGLTSLDDVEGWVEEGRRLNDKFDHGRTLNRLLDSLENHINAPNAEDSSPFTRTVHPNQEEALRQFDYLSSVMPVQNLARSFVDEEILARRGHKYDDADESHRGRSFQQWTQVSRPRQTSGQRVKVSRGLSESEGDSSDGYDSDEDRHSVISNNHRESKRSGHAKKRSPLPSPSTYTRRAPSIRGEHLLHYDASEHEGQWRSSPRGKKHSRRNGAGRHQVDIGRTIQALQADRRQKTAWIQSHRRLPPSRSPRYNSALL